MSVPMFPTRVREWTLREEGAKSGSAAVVARAAHDLGGDHFVMKLLLPHTRTIPDFQARIRLAARMAYKVRDDFVVETLPPVEEGGIFYWPMIHAPGRTLAEWLAELGSTPLAPTLALGYLAQVAAGAAAMHKAGVIHRNIKPANLLVGDDGVVRLMGFLNACPRTGDEAGAGGVRGTPAYMAPESLRGGDAGPGADVYALGVTLYRALTGRLPFEMGDERDPSRIVDRILATHRDGVVPPSRFAPGLSGDIDTITLRAMSGDPATRFPDATALADALNAIGAEG